MLKIRIVGNLKGLAAVTQSLPLILACPGQYIHRRLWRWMLNTVTYHPGLSLHSILHFVCKFIESVRIMICVSWLSHLKAIKWKVCLNTFISMSSWWLRSCRLHRVCVRWLQLAEQWSPVLTGLWWLSNQCTKRSCGLLFFSMRGLMSSFACWPFSSVPSHVFWQEGLYRGAGISVGIFPISSTFLLQTLLEFCLLAYVQYWFIYSPHPRFTLCQSVEFCSFMASLSGLGEFFFVFFCGSSEVCFYLFNFLSSLHSREI